MTKQPPKNTSRLNCSDEELQRMRSRSPETRLNWLHAALVFSKTKKTIK